jgi:hypothetical protein
MAYTTIDKPDDYFNTVLYTGDDVDGRAITTGFQTDWTWIKRRNDTNSHIISDIVRGATYKLDSSSTSAEVNNYDGGHLESFTSTGFTLGEGSVNSGHTNATGGTYVSWNWKAGGTAVSNTEGSITSSVSANTTSGFSIVKFTSGASAGYSVGHGLGTTPSVIIQKITNDTGGWLFCHKDMDASGITSGFLQLQTTDAFTSNANVFTNVNDLTVTQGSVISNNYEQIMYCFAEVKGYSKFGSYTGNGNTDGPFVYTGFKPAFVMIKNASAGSTDWYLYDNKRGGPASGVYGNNNKFFLKPNSSAAEGNESFDMYSNGFKIKISNSFLNGSGNTLIYMAFAEQPFVTSTANGSIPATAR